MWVHNLYSHPIGGYFEVLVEVYSPVERLVHQPTQMAFLAANVRVV